MKFRDWSMKVEEIKKVELMEYIKGLLNEMQKDNGG